MYLDLQALGQKLKRYREQLQASLGEVSEATGIPEDKLIDFEEGKIEPTGDELLIVSDYFKCDYRFFVSNEKLAPMEETELLFRKHGAELSKEDRWAILEFLYLCACEEFLVRQMDVFKRSAFTFEKQGSYYIGHGKEAADKLRRTLGYRDIEVPRDIYEDFRRIGLHVFRRQLANSNISGLYLKHPTAGKCVLVNYSEDVYRQRFTAAHEAGHAILDEEEDFVISFSSWDRKDLKEIRANSFASSFLMPPEFLAKVPQSRYSTPQSAADLANELRVSTEAFSYALKEAKLVSDSYVSEIKAVKIPSEKKQDPELSGSLSPQTRERRQYFLKRGLSPFYVDLCFRGYEEGFISAGRMAEMLLASDTELLQISEVFGRKLRHGY